jgi:phosphoribosylanthranilate isomerase
MVKIKICGITSLDDARSSIGAGCDALGFVFYKKSPRYIAPAAAKAIISRLPKRIAKIGVFVDTPEKSVKRIAKFCGLDALQFHGRQTPEFCARFKGYKIIKAFRIKEGRGPEDISRYRPFACLFDTFVKTKAGGTGKRFDWKLIRGVRGLGHPIFLSGGLNEKNVKQAIKVVRPDWVDVSSGVEKKPGKKDRAKVKRFISAVKKR